MRLNSYRYQSRRTCRSPPDPPYDPHRTTLRASIICFYLYVLPRYPVVHGSEHRAFHLQLHKLISSCAEELRIKVVLDERVQVPEDGFPIDSTEFDADLLSGRNLRADLVVRAFVASFASTLTSIHRSVLPATRLYLHHCAHSHQSALHQMVSFPCNLLSNSLTPHIQQYLRSAMSRIRRTKRWHGALSSMRMW